MNLKSVVTIAFSSTFPLLIALSACGGHPRVNEEICDAEPAPWDLLDEGELPPISSIQPGIAQDSAIDADELPEEDSSVDNSSEDLESRDSIPTLYLPDVRGIRDLGKVFNDSNKYQYAAGERIGIKPIRSVADAYFTRRPLVKISSCEWYNVEPLTHSIPYLVPEAAKLLETIGRNFNDSLKSHNASGHKIRITSILRTSGSVKKLRRINSNATDSSTHQLATTFDISYARFDHDGKSPRVSDGQLKLILAEVLYDLRMQNKCLVKYERKSPCFHITATGK